MDTLIKEFVLAEVTKYIKENTPSIEEKYVCPKKLSERCSPVKYKNRKMCTKCWKIHQHQLYERFKIKKMSLNHNNQE